MTYTEFIDHLEWCIVEIDHWSKLSKRVKQGETIEDNKPEYIEQQLNHWEAEQDVTAKIANINPLNVLNILAYDPENRKRLFMKAKRLKNKRLLDINKL